MWHTSERRPSGILPCAANALQAVPLLSGAMSGVGCLTECLPECILPREERHTGHFRLSIQLKHRDSERKRNREVEGRRVEGGRRN